MQQLFPAFSNPYAGLTLHELNPLAVAQGGLRLHASCQNSHGKLFKFFSSFLVTASWFGTTSDRLDSSEGRRVRTSLPTFSWQGLTPLDTCGCMRSSSISNRLLSFIFTEDYTNRYPRYVWESSSNNWLPSLSL